MPELACTFCLSLYRTQIGVSVALDFPSEDTPPRPVASVYFYAGAGYLPVGGGHSSTSGSASIGLIALDSTGAPNPTLLTTLGDGGDEDWPKAVVHRPPFRASVLVSTMGAPARPVTYLPAPAPRQSADEVPAQPVFYGTILTPNVDNDDNDTILDPEHPPTDSDELPYALGVLNPSDDDLISARLNISPFLAHVDQLLAQDPSLRSNSELVVNLRLEGHTRAFWMRDSRVVLDDAAGFATGRRTVTLRLPLDELNDPAYSNHPLIPLVHGGTIGLHLEGLHGFKGGLIGLDGGLVIAGGSPGAVIPGGSPGAPEPAPDQWLLVLDATADLVPIDLGVDNNRDGTLALGSLTDQTSEHKPYRFWLNNDHDNYGTADTYNAEDDHPWTTQTLDNANEKIEPERDLDDFARLHLKVDSLHSQLIAGTMTLGLKWKTVQSGTPKIRLFRAADTDGGTKYLSDTAKAADQRSVGSTSIGVVQGTTTLDLPVSFWTSTSTSPTKFFLFEGLGEGKGELTLVLKQGTTVLGEGGSVFLDLIDIRRMYERWKIADAAIFSGPDSTATPTVSGVTSVSDPNGFAFQAAWDEDLDDKSYIICVHGWRKTYYAARSDEITIFKRLWHRGFKGRFAGFKWPTLTGGEIEAKFNHSEYRAWKCGDAFKTFVETQLPSGYRKNVIAHSLGNVVVSSALNKGLRFDRYALLNAAIPAQCFDPNPALKQAAATQTLVYGSLSIDYSAWAGGDLGDDTLPGLRALAYRSRVGGAPLGAMLLVNFFLERDADVGESGWEANQWGAGDYIPVIDSKPIDDYDYDIGIRLHFDPVGPGDRAVTDPHEAMAMANQSMTKALGVESRTAGAVTGSVNMDDPGMLFGDAHEAVFKFLPSKTWEFYRRLLVELDYSPKP